MALSSDGNARARRGADCRGRRKNVIFVLMSGGPSHSEQLHLKEGTLDAIFRGADFLWRYPLAAGNNAETGGPDGQYCASPVDTIVGCSRRFGQDVDPNWTQSYFGPCQDSSPHRSVVSLEIGAGKKATLPAFVSLNTATGPAQGYLAPDHAPFMSILMGPRLESGAIRTARLRSSRAIRCYRLWTTKIGMVRPQSGPLRMKWSL